jgi:hypothetical protein
MTTLPQVRLLRKLRGATLKDFLEQLLRRSNNKIDAVNLWNHPIEAPQTVLSTAHSLAFPPTSAAFLKGLCGFEAKHVVLTVFWNLPPDLSDIDLVHKLCLEILGTLQQS